MCIALSGLCATAQQAGDMAVGLNLGVAPLLESGANTTNFGIGAKFQYNVTNPIRLEADANYWFKSNGLDLFDVSVNLHYLFHCGEKFTLFPLVGIGYAHVNDVSNGGDYDYNNYYSEISRKDYDDSDEDGRPSANRFLFNVGIGTEYAITTKISIGLEIKYQYMKDFSRLPITIGATYRF